MAMSMMLREPLPRGLGLTVAFEFGPALQEARPSVVKRGDQDANILGQEHAGRGVLLDEGEHGS
jgi:hypothetical protein